MWASGDSEAVNFWSHGPRSSFAISNETLVPGLFLVDYCPLWPRTADLGQSWIVTRRGRLGDLDCLSLVSEWRRSSTVILYSFALASAASEPKDTRGSRGRAMGIHSLLSTSFLSPIGQALHSALRILGYQLCLKSSLSEPSSHRLPLVPLLRPSPFLPAMLADRRAPLSCLLILFPAMTSVTPRNQTDPNGFFANSPYSK